MRQEVANQTQPLSFADRYSILVLNTPVMRLSPILLRILLAFGLAVIGFILGGTLGGMTIDQSDGLAGAAIVFWYSFFGAVLGIISGIVIPRYLSYSSLRSISLLLGALALLVIGILVFQYATSGQNTPANYPPDIAPDLLLKEDDDAIS